MMDDDFGTTTTTTASSIDESDDSIIVLKSKLQFNLIVCLAIFVCFVLFCF